MISGFVLAKKGEKISKSKNNSTLTPTGLIAAYSADAVRYWTAGAKLGTDTFFSTDDLAAARRFLTKLWNACKFSLSHLQDFASAQKPELLPIDRWIIARAGEITCRVQTLLYEYETGLARHEIDDFFWKDFCDNYIEIVKERLYRPDIHGEKERKSGQYALYHTLLCILKLYAIYVPHITEYIYQEFFRQHEQEISLHLLHWNDTQGGDTPMLLAFGENVIRILTQIRRFKSENNLSMRDEVDTLIIDAPENLHPLFKQTEKDLLACSKARTITYASPAAET